jgi:pyruvate,water dikinase
VHPKAILDYPNIDPDLKKAVESVARGHASPRAFYVDKLAEGMATIAAAFWPKPVIVRLSDFKSNEYRKLIGGSALRARRREPDAGLPRRQPLHQRRIRDAFAMECEALKRVRNDMGLTNVEIMVPFVRTVKQAERVARCWPSVAWQARPERPARDHDVRGAQQRHPGRPVPAALRRHVDRLERPDPAHAGPGPRLGLEQLAADFDERDPAVKALISRAIAACRAPASTSASAARAPATTPTSPTGWRPRASCRSR